MTGLPEIWRRRALLGGGALLIAGWVVGAPRLVSLRGSHLSFRVLPNLAPFRELERKGAVSATGGMFVGLDQETDPSKGIERRIATVRANPCQALYGRWPDSSIPVAFFSDFNCPNCRALDTVLTEYEAAHPQAIRLFRHELPLLGATSVTASKAVLAAGQQGKGEEMRARLMRTPMVTDLGFVTAAAKAAGLNPDQLLEDMQRPEIEEALQTSTAIAKIFGFFGTPATVVGRTVFMGTISARDFADIIAAEQILPPLDCAMR